MVVIVDLLIILNSPFLRAAPQLSVSLSLPLFPPTPTLNPGVCGSDVHTITGGWGELGSGWVCPGHEIVGKVTHVGDEVTEFKVGQRVGVGAQVYSCLKCDRCKNNNENYCPEMVDTYNAKFPDGVETQGGYSTTIRTHDQYVFAIPDALKSEDAAPMLCAGLTVYSPLVRNGTGPGKRVGIVGIGGLGREFKAPHLPHLPSSPWAWPSELHRAPSPATLQTHPLIADFAIQFAKALGAEVVVFSHSANKEKDARDLGADDFVLTSEKDFAKPLFSTLDYILSAADAAKLPISDLVTCLKVGGQFTSVGLPDGNWEDLHPMKLMGSAAAVGATHIGSKKEAYDMLDLAAKKGVAPIIDEVLPMSQAAKAIEAVKNNTVRYRYVLRNDLD